MFALLMGVLAPASWFQPPGKQESHRIWALDEVSTGGEGMLPLPFVTPGKSYGVALDGGRIPLFAYEVPRLHFGPQVDCLLHLLMVADLQTAESRDLLLLIHESYEADSASTLPPLALTLLPSVEVGAGESVRDNLIAAHFVSNTAGTLPGLLRSTRMGSTAVELGAIRGNLREAEPDILERIDSTLSSRQDFITNVLRSAQSQAGTNSRLRGCRESTQLVSMRKILTGSPDVGQLASFLAGAMSRQHAYLSSPAGKVPVIPPSGCDCKDSDHAHWSPT